jgi:O-antigen/teichoic acid export membrane protein
MINFIKQKTYRFLKWTEKWTKTDMIYLAKGSFWLSTAQAFSVPLGIASSVVFANFLPKETYGSYKYILSILGILYIPTLGSMATALTQAVANGFEGSLVDAIKTKMKWGLIGSLASIGLSIYYFLHHDDKLGIAFIILPLFIPSMNALTLYKDFLSGKKKFKTSAKISVLSKFITVSILLLSVILTRNLYIILIAYFLPSIIINTFLVRYTLKNFATNSKKDPKTIPFGIYMSLLGIVTKIANEADKILLFHFLGASSLAIYTFAMAPVDVASGYISNNIITLAMPKLSSSSTQMIQNTLPQKIFRATLLTVPLMLLYMFAAPLIYKFLYPQYVGSILYSKIYALTYLLIPLSLLSSTLIAKMKKREIAYVRIISPSFRILLMLIMVTNYGIMGLIVAQIIAGFFHVGLTGFLFKRLV